MSKDEERRLERERQSGGGGYASSSAGRGKKVKKEGGLEVIVEITNENHLRVRARRCNYAPGTVIKEITEDTILGKLRTSMQVWQKDIASMM